MEEAVSEPKIVNFEEESEGDEGMNKDGEEGSVDGTGNSDSGDSD